VSQLFDVITGLPESDLRPDSIDVDYIAIASNSVSSSIRDNLTPIRLAVTGRNVKVFVGKDESPLIEENQFLALPNARRFVRFGKIDTAEPSSIWGWGNLRYLAGEALPPVQRDIYDFHLTWRLPSAGGARVLVSHDGTAHVLSDGVYTNQRADNPDDRQIKLFAYNSDTETWKLESPSPNRSVVDSSLLGITRPFDAASVRGSLFVLGQRSNIRYSV
jgi:hypothetical protein